MKSNKIFLLIIISFMLFSGCATNLPMSSTLNDFVMMGTKTNSTDNVSYTYKTNIVDGLIKPYERDKTKELGGHPGFNHTQSSTLNRMINEYIGNKFSKLSDNGGVTITLELKDFWLEQYPVDSGGKIAMAALIGGEVNIMCLAKVKVLLTINKDGQEFTKIINGTSEDTYIAGYGTGTSTSNLYQGKNSLENTHANNINKANNKVVMLMNSYFEEIGL